MEYSESVEEIFSNIKSPKPDLYRLRILWKKVDWEEVLEHLEKSEKETFLGRVLTTTIKDLLTREDRDINITTLSSFV